MGSGSWSADKWRGYSATTVGKSVDAIYSSRHMENSLDPKGVAIRESRDSTDNPESTAIIMALDVTGSMGMIAQTIAQSGLGILFQEILDRKPVTDPHLMFMALGDVACDHAPLQVSQFEADNRIIEQLAKIYVEHGGGGNESESYDFPWYFAAQHTSIDCFEKRGKKGYLFTFGDEMSPYGLTKEQIKEFLGETVETDYTAAQLLAMVEKMYHVYHIIIAEGSYARYRLDRVKADWVNLMGQRAIVLEDHTKLAELVVSLIQISEGANKKAVVDSWNGDTSLVIQNAVQDLTIGDATVSASGVVTL